MAWTERYLNLGATFNGDGTASNDAASGGAPGAWNSWANAVTGLGTVSAAMRVNLKGTATLGADVNLNNAGTAVNTPIWWRGYVTTPGDCDSNFALTRPKTTLNAGFRVLLASGYQLLNSLDFAGNYDFSALFRNSGGGALRYYRVKGVNSSTVSTAAVAESNGGAVNAVLCHFEMSYNATPLGVFRANGISSVLSGCWLQGAKSGVYVDASGTVALTLLNNIFIQNNVASTYGIYVTDGTFLRMLCINGNTFYNTGSDAISLKQAAPSIDTVFIANNILDTIGGYAINDTDASAGGVWSIYNNLTHAVTSGFANNLVNDASGDGSALGTQTDSGTPFTSAGTDFSILSTSNAKANGLPGTFDTGTVGYMDIGAAQRQESGGSSGMLYVPNLEGT